MMNKQLFCLTYAGGNASFFDEIEKDLVGYDVVKLEYSGHGIRHKEPCYNDFDELAEDMYSLIKDAFQGGEYALFGYSMGSISLIEVLRRIIVTDAFPNPSRVFLAAHQPQTRTEIVDMSDGELDEYVKERTVKFGTIPDILLKNNVFWRMYLPIFRADYSLLAKYKFEDLKFKTSIPATVFYSATDTSTEDMLRWKHFFTGDCDYYSFEGNHFFIQKHHEEMASIISMKF